MCRGMEVDVEETEGGGSKKCQSKRETATENARPAS
jgi:hypothetical protein